MILKSYLIEKDIKILDQYYASLFYGENIGLKDDLKKRIKENYKHIELINLHQEDILKNKKILEEQIQNISLFSEKKIIIINYVSEKLKNILIPLVENPETNIKIFIFAQNLEKKSLIRSHFEKNKSTCIVACYPDNERTLGEYIRTNLRDYAGVNQEVINLLVYNSGMDRKTLKHEIEKIKSLFLDKKVTFDKVAQLINNPNNIDFNNLRDCSLSADKVALNKGLGNVILQNEEIYLYLGSLSSRIKRLIDLRNLYDHSKNLHNSLNDLKPKIFWKDKPIFEKQVKKWDISKLLNAKKLVIDTEIKIKTSFLNSNDILIKKLLVELCQMASSSFSK
tara:strand:- start:239 stop:1249 length:1011 start_codon:yes stop_codon:yes gene_type:complete